MKIAPRSLVTFPFPHKNLTGEHGQPRQSLLLTRDLKEKPSLGKLSGDRRGWDEAWSQGWTIQVAGSPQGCGLISKPRTQSVSLTQRHRVHSTPVYTACWFVLNVPLVKSTKLVLLWPAQPSILTAQGSCCRTAGLRTVRLILLNTLLLNHA